jgi:hypothetical protein
MKPTLYTTDSAGEEVEIELPFRWEICSRCEGCGTDRGASVECDGGGFTSSEWAEQDDDFKEDYLAGRYDKPCANCCGTGKVQVVNYEKMTKAQRKLWDDQCREDALDRCIERMERESGA